MAMETQWHNHRIISVGLHQIGLHEKQSKGAISPGAVLYVTTDFCSSVCKDLTIRRKIYSKNPVLLAYLQLLAKSLY